MTELGERLLLVMRQRDLSPKEVAAMISRCRKTFYNFLNGRASSRVEAKILITFPELHTFTHYKRKN